MAVFETSDIGVAEQLIKESYGGSLRIETRGPHGGFRQEQTQVSPAVRLDRVRFAISFLARAQPLGVLIIGHSRSGRIAFRSGGSERRYGPGEVGLSVQPGLSYTARCEDIEREIAVIDPALPGRIADTAPGRRPQPIRFTGYEPISPEAARAWKNTYAYVRGVIVSDPAAAAQPLVAAASARLLAATALAVFPNTALTDPTIEDRHDAHPDTLRRAVAFVDENAHTDLTVADIAAAAQVTMRTIQLAFRRHLSLTPTAYLCRVRLEHAHKDLRSAAPGTDSVTAVAYRWGFTSSSRFAIAYRRAYGVTPEQTLSQD